MGDLGSVFFDPAAVLAADSIDTRDLQVDTRLPRAAREVVRSLVVEWIQTDQGRSPDDPPEP
jgi:hypothetical protein